MRSQNFETLVKIPRVHAFEMIFQKAGMSSVMRDLAVGNQRPASVISVVYHTKMRKRKEFDHKRVSVSVALTGRFHSCRQVKMPRC
jgi:hypothetical protein